MFFFCNVPSAVAERSVRGAGERREKARARARARERERASEREREINPETSSEDGFVAFESETATRVRLQLD